jgi:Ca-activated chloride channel family protein
VPAAASLLALVALVVGFARPAIESRVPRERATVVLALDISGSMEATDVAPSRLEAMQTAAQRFVGELPTSFNVGLVIFSSVAFEAVELTTDHESVQSGIASLQSLFGTAIGEAVFTSLDAIASFNESTDDPPAASIVLLSDGASLEGRPLEAASEAARQASVPVHTIAYGTPEGMVDSQPVPVDAAALERVAATTGGTFHPAGSGTELTDVYESIRESLGYQEKLHEAWGWFVGVGALLLALAVGVLARRLPARRPRAPQP